MLESILRAAGYRTGLYTSPHLVRYNERVRIAGVEADDEALCEGFEAVEAARGGVPLTYFEFGTLAAFWVFRESEIEAAILEVGLGGRLDAVNAVDADCAVLTSVGIDHVDYLGADRESIGREKAGIFRAGPPGGDRRARSAAFGARRGGQQALPRTRTSASSGSESQWAYWGPRGKRAGLAHPALRGSIQLRNAAAVLCALDALELPVAMQDVRRGLAEVTLARALPGAARPPAGDPRRRAQRRGGAQPRRQPRRVRLRARDHRGVRHAARQGHRRRAARAGAAHHALASRLAARPARRLGAKTWQSICDCAASTERKNSLRPRDALAAALERAERG